MADPWLLGYGDDGQPVYHEDPPPVGRPPELDRYAGMIPPWYRPGEQPMSPDQLQRVLDEVFSQPGFHTIPGEERPADGICEVQDPFGRCTAVVAWRIWVGCIQEHLVMAEVCERHMGLIESEAVHNFCRPCRKHNQAIVDMTPQADETIHVLRREKL